MNAILRNQVGLCIVLVVLLGSTITSANVLTIDPGQYGSYRADTSVVRYGTYSFRPQGGSNIWQDRSGTQNVDLGTLADGTYEVFARDANVLIGSFVNTAGVPSAGSGSVTLVGNTLTFVNHNIAVSGSWTYPSAKIFNVAWSEIDVALFVLPAGNGWDGWWTTIGLTAFVIDIDASGVVTVASESPAIGISGGANQLVFSNDVEPIIITVSNQPSDSAYWNLDWSSPNLAFSPNNLDLYAGTYRLNMHGNGFWVGPSEVTVPLNSVGWVEVLTWHSNTDNNDITFTFEGPEPPCTECSDYLTTVLNAVCGVSASTYRTYRQEVEQLVQDTVTTPVCSQSGGPGSAGELDCEDYIQGVLLDASLCAAIRAAVE